MFGSILIVKRTTIVHGSGACHLGTLQITCAFVSFSLPILRARIIMATHGPFSPGLVQNLQRQEQEETMAVAIAIAGIARLLLPYGKALVKAVVPFMVGERGRESGHGVPPDRLE